MCKHKRKGKVLKLLKNCLPRFHNTVEPHYQQILYLQVHQLKLICNSKINTCSIFMVICRHSQRKKKMSHLTVCFQLREEKRPHSAFLFQLSYCKQASFSGSIQCQVFYILCFSVDLTIGKGPSAHCCVPKHRKISLYLMEKTGVR